VKSIPASSNTRIFVSMFIEYSQQISRSAQPSSDLLEQTLQCDTGWSWPSDLRVRDRTEANG